MRNKMRMSLIQGEEGGFELKQLKCSPLLHSHFRFKVKDLLPILPSFHFTSSHSLTFLHFCITSISSSHHPFLLFLPIKCVADIYNKHRFSSLSPPPHTVYSVLTSKFGRSVGSHHQTRQKRDDEQVRMK